MKLDQLWEYTQLDMAAERFEADMRKAPNRVKLLKLRNFLVEQQNNNKKVEGDVSAMAERVETVKTEMSKQMNILAELQKEIAEAQDDSIAELEGLIEEAQRLSSSLSKYEAELKKIRKEVENKDRQLREIRSQAAKCKAEYDQLKAEYDVEFKRDSNTLKDLKAKVEAYGKTISPDLIERYKSTRQRCMPPMAKLINGQCGGCNMSLPSAVLRRITENDEIIECDNCGAILYAKD